MSMLYYIGRGAVVLSFSSPRKAQLFLSNAKQAKESALYLCVKDLQKFTFDDKRDKVRCLNIGGTCTFRSSAFIGDLPRLIMANFAN